MTEQTVTLVLTAAQAAALEYIVDDWKDAVGPDEVDDADGRNAVEQVGYLYEAIVLAQDEDEEPAAEYVPVEVTVLDADSSEAMELAPEDVYTLLYDAGVDLSGKLPQSAVFHGDYLVEISARWFEDNVEQGGEWTSPANHIGLVASISRP